MILMGKMGLVGAEEIKNIEEEVCEFEPQITFYVGSDSMIALQKYIVKPKF